MMKKRLANMKLTSPLGLIVTIIIISIYGCENLSISQSNLTTSNPNPNSIPATKQAPTPDNISKFSTIEIIPPISAFSKQSLPTATLQSVNALSELFYTTIQPQEIVWEMLGKVNLERTLSDLKSLTGETPVCIASQCYSINNRLTGSEGLGWAKDYVFQELAGLGYSVEYIDWSRSGHADQNIIARKPGLITPEEEIFFVAHLDGVKTAEAERFPAADDDASGVVDLIELARVLRDYSFSRTVVLFFSTGEEQGTLGVQSYLNQLPPAELTAIKYAIDIDMIGYDANQDGLMELWHGGESQSIDLATTLIEIIQAYQLDLEPVLVVGCG
jgi:hypothetical protein